MVLDIEEMSIGLEWQKGGANEEGSEGNAIQPRIRGGCMYVVEEVVVLCEAVIYYSACGGGAE